MEEVHCSLCHADMEYKVFDKKNSEEKTHARVCVECPGILFEFYDLDDVKNLETYLRKPWNEQV